MKHRGWIILSGLVWAAIGFLLLSKGVGLLGDRPLSLALGFFIGFFKGRFVLVKTVRRVVARIATLSLPIQIKQVYAPSYYFLILGMMSLGMLMRHLPISAAVRGVIDVAIGIALMHGAMLYFRAARLYDKSSPSQSL
ncbi:MAG: hypothetical protein KGQ49_06440 [Verrucomicrobia bacterium]|nr:hypothetical protein [Verrucomicrobiota bacterium]MBU6447019.1 hypothetical protein [Verrucomicrobiota bacterium]MDE3046789.1 hypothetical protein [Verrucomicrobiota bacterium]